MTRLVQEDLLKAIDIFTSGEAEFDVLRRFVFSYFEGESDVELKEGMDEVFAVLGPYMEYEEAYGDAMRLERMRRLRSALSERGASAERAVFALEFDKIQALHSKLVKGTIPRAVYEEQLRKLSPADFDHRRLALWAAAHEGRGEADVGLMS